jgi:hypothetical protein
MENKMKKYNKHYLKRDPASGVVLAENNKPVLGDVVKKDIPLEDWQVKTLNRSWKKTGIYFSEEKQEEKKTGRPAIKKD